MLGGMADVREMSTSMWKKLCRAYWSPEFLRFLVFGGLAALTNLGIGYILYSNDLLPYFFAVFFGSASGLLVNFLCNYYFNFRYRGRTLIHQFSTFFIVAGVGTLLNALIAKLFLLFGHWLLPALPASALKTLLTAHLEIGCHILSIGVVTFYSFLGHKYFSFNEGIRAFWKKRRGSHAC